MKYLFVGNFFIHTRGTTKPVSHRVITRLTSDFIFTIHTAGVFSNKILRVADIFFKSLLVRYSTIHIDVFSGPSFFLAWLAGFIGKIRGKKVILNLRGGALKDFEQRHPLITNSLFSRATVLVSPSLFLQDYFSSKGYKVDYLPNYLDYDHQAPARSVRNRFSLLWVRAFTTIYNPELAIHTLHQLLIKYPEATLTMVGPDMGLRHNCEVLTRQLGLEKKVHFIGPVKHQDLPDFYLTHSILLNTTSFESFGNAVMESAYYGTPAVSYKVGEIPFLWKDRVNILLAENLTAQDFANNVAFLFEDVDSYYRISENAKINAALYSWDIMKEYWYNLLR